jgi:mannose-6-phosphate isomerase
VGIVVALLMNHVELMPGQALFLPPGNVHSYLEGVAIEVMAPSDNVIRGGLTSKHIDVAELLQVLDPRPVVPDVQRAAGGRHDYQVPGAGFGLAQIDLDQCPSSQVSGPGILLSAAEGTARLESSSTGLQVQPGQAALVRADDGPVLVTGTGVVHWAQGTAPTTG